MNHCQLVYALNVFTSMVFIPDLDGSIIFCTGIFPFLIYFLTHEEAVDFHSKTGPNKWTASGYRRILKEFRDAVVTRFGKGIECQDRQKRVAFRLKLAYDFKNIASIEPVMTREFDNFEEMKPYLHSISKIAVKRAFPFFFNTEVPYFHTGILLQRQDGTVDMAEVVVEGTSARLQIQNSAIALARNACDEPKMLLDTRLIGQTGNVNVPAILFKIAALRETLVAYNVFEFNCDHFANFILFDRIAWTTKTFDVPEAFRQAPNFPFAEVTKETFNALKIWITIHDNLNVTFKNKLIL